MTNPPARNVQTHLVGWAHRQRLLGALVLMGPLVFSCDERGAQDATPPAPSSSVRPAPAKSAAPQKLELSCREAKQGARFLVGEVGKPRANAPLRGDDEDDEAVVDLPFSVEAGGAVASSTGFALAALENRKAIAVTLARDAASGRRIELAEVHGDVEPPRLASSGDQIVAAVAGNDAGSSTLTLMAFRPDEGAASLKRGAQVSRSREAGVAFDLVLAPKRGVMVWDQWDASKSRGIIEALSFEPVTVQAQASARVLSASDDDAESPRVLLRRGGFWVSWVSHAPLAKTARRAPRAGASANPGSDPKDAGAEAVYDSVVELTPRRLKLLRLDEQGVPSGEPTLVSAPDAHVLAYDAVPFGDGVLFAWRDDPTSLGAEAPKIHLARVAPDGTVSLEVIDDEEVAEGAPRLFSDRGGAVQPQTWLALMGKRGRSRVGHVEPSGKLAGPLQDVAEFGHNEPLALESGRFLLAQPRGRALDLSVVQCALGSAKSQK